MLRAPVAFPRVCSFLGAVSVWFAFSALGGGCAAQRRGESGECLFNGDCAEPLVCAGNFCRVECRTDRDCAPQVGTSCQPSDKYGVQVCLPPDADRLCAYSSDCRQPLVCNPNRRCSAQCQTDYDCRATDSNVTCVTVPDAGGTCSNNPYFDPPADGSASVDAGAGG